MMQTYEKYCQYLFESPEKHIPKNDTCIYINFNSPDIVEADYAILQHVRHYPEYNQNIVVLT